MSDGDAGITINPEIKLMQEAIGQRYSFRALMMIEFPAFFFLTGFNLFNGRWVDASVNIVMAAVLCTALLLFRGEAGKDVSPFAAQLLPLPAGRYVELCVSDSGIGIAPGDRERIFEPFEQADNSPSRRYQGTGLGLPLTRRLVELHGGRVWAESPGEGKGSSFRVLIPHCPGPDSPPTPG